MINFFTHMVQVALNDAPVIPSEDVTLLDESFSTLPGDWNNQYNHFTVNNGLEISGTGNMNHRIEYTVPSYLDNQITKVEFVVNDLTSSFGVGKNQALRGNVVKADFNSNTLQLGILAVSNTEPTYEFTIPLTNITKTIGNTYVLEFVRNRQKVEARIYDKSSPLNVDEIIRDYDIDDTFAGSGWGTPCAWFFSGDIKITNFKYLSTYSENSKVAMFGDSIIEGYTLIEFVGNVKNRWADKLMVSNGFSAYISAKGGMMADDADSYIDFELLHLSSDYAILFYGSNDSLYSSFSVWQSSILSMISKLEALGTIPIVCTVLPRSGGQTVINQMNDYLLNTLSASYDVIDFAASVTDNRDRLTWTSGYLLPDNIHPSVDGHIAMYQEIVNNHNYLI